MEHDIQALIARYGDAEIRGAIKKMHISDNSKSAKLAAGFAKLLEDVGAISMKRFKKEAALAWKKAYPDGMEKKPLRGYQLFVKETMPKVKSENPDKSHHERMTIIGRLWKQHCNPEPTETIPEPEPEPEPEPTTRTRTRKRRANV